MPIIDGVKMACEPCIRGHRSTKCTHGSERLLVPVKKPGRPLSTCPHLNVTLCGCSSITAIPRKPKCSNCPTDASIAPNPGPRPLASAIPDTPSPTKVAFKVSKSRSSSSSRSQTHDGKSFERTDPEAFNFVEFQPKRAQAIASASSIRPRPSNRGSTNPPINTYVGEIQGGHPSVSNQTNGSTFTLPQNQSSRRSSLHHVEYANNDAESFSHGFEQPAMILDAPQGYSTSQPFQTSSFDQATFPPYNPQRMVYAYSPGPFQQPIQPTEWQHRDFLDVYESSQTSQDSTLQDGRTFQNGRTLQDGVALKDDVILQNGENFSDRVIFQDGVPLPDGVIFQNGMLFQNGLLLRGELDTSCNCGDDCNCLGCVLHPYNPTTQGFGSLLDPES